MAADANPELGAYIVRPLLWEELPLAKSNRKEMGLLIGCHQLETIWKSDPGSVYGAITEEGELYGTCAVPAVGADTCYLCMFGVMPQYRRRGIGKQLMTAAMTYADKRNVFFYSPLDYVHFFRDKWHFQLYYRSIHVLGPGIPDVSQVKLGIPGVTICPMSKDLLPLVVKYDEAVFGTYRRKFLELALSEHDGTVAVACHTPLKICGYGHITGDIYGRTILRTVFADDQDIAEVIIGWLLRECPHSLTLGVCMMLKPSTEEDTYFQEKLKLPMTSCLKMMFRWPSSKGDLSKIFVTS